MIPTMPSRLFNQVLLRAAKIEEDARNEGRLWSPETDVVSLLSEKDAASCSGTPVRLSEKKIEHRAMLQAFGAMLGDIALKVNSHV
jgi:hypothetical protein